jgi:arsenate reductase
MIKLYGIPNCNTVKKAQLFLDNAKIDYEFINFKKTPPTMTQINKWKKAFGDWPVNKKGPTYRKIKDEFEAADAKAKKDLLINTTSAIKRPILEVKGDVKAFGFSEDEYQSIF